MTIAEALDWATARLQPTSDSPRLDAEVLLAFALGTNRAHLYTWPERVPEAPLLDKAKTLVEQRANGTPVAYLTGRQEFWSLPLEVGAATLIPRPATERLVELALERLPAGRTTSVLDLGTGSGAIALAIASERPLARVTAVDASGAALQIADRNRQHLKLAVELLQGDWYEPVAHRRFDLIVSNPPYIGTDEPEPGIGDCRFEPRQALIADDSGLADLRRIISQAPLQLEPGGHLLVEHGYRQGPVCRASFEAAGFANVSTARDLQGHERVTLGHWSP
jgi:release factor glutamine methyltransferase